MKLNVKTLCITLVAIICLIGFKAFGQSVQEKTMFYGENITGIEVSSAFDVAVIKGSDNYLKLEYDPIFEGRIEAKINNGILNLKLAKGKYNEQSNSKIVLKAIVCVSDLTQVTASGSVDIHFIGKYAPKEIVITASGATDLIGLNCETEKFNATCTGSSDINDFIIIASETSIMASGSSDLTNLNLKSTKANVVLAGSSDLEKVVLDVDNLLLSATGSSDIENMQCTAHDANISLVGSSDLAKSSLQTNRLDLQMTGASSCILTGKATDAEIAIASSASASMKSFEIENLTTRLSGASTGSFKVNGKLSLNVSSSSDLHIYGSPQIEKSISDDNSSVHFY